MGALCRAPGVVLRGSVLSLFGGMPADGGWIKEDVGAGERCQARGFGIPLVPADECGDASELRVECAEAEISRREVELFEEKRIVGNVHLAINSEQRSIGVNDRRRVVVKARRALLEKRSDDHDTQLGRERAQTFGRWPRNGFRQIEKPGILFAAEILRTEQLLQTDDLRAFLRRFADPLDRMVEIRLRIEAARHLHERDPELFGSHRNYSRGLMDLVLFDIDGTLVRRAGPHHRQALVDAIRQVAGVETTTDGIPVHGMLDPDILTRMMRAAGIDGTGIGSMMPAIIAAAQDVYQTGVPDLRDKVCPGVVPLLDHLRARGTVLALVTGNLTRIGWRKLERAGLRDYFRFGAFGEMAPTRGGLARLAIERARRTEFVGENSRISLIGDAVQDVAAAHENGIRAIAVR